MKTSYRKGDYVYGSTMLLLRTEIGLTQAELANHLGISRRAVGEWEAGNSYPKAKHLKELITLGVKSQAFTKGSEAREIHKLWKMAHQRALIDEYWLSALLGQERSPHLHIVPKTTEESRSSAPVMAEVLPEPRAPAASPRVDWGDALAVPTFYGREQEQAQLIQWMVQERCQVVSVLGMGGIGKSALSVSLMYQIAEHFEEVIFRSLRDAPSCEALLDGCLQVLSPQLLSVSSAGQAQGSVPTERRISLLLEHFRTNRTLVILDNLECLLQEGDTRGRFRPGFEGYGQLLRRVAETMHQSCLLITSREKPADLRPLEGKHSPVHSLRLTGLDVATCQQIFVEKEIVGTEGEQERLISLYGGNPLALKMIAETISDLFGGEIGPLLGSETLVFGSISDLLSEQIARLSSLEQSMLYWLATMRESVTLDELQELLAIPLPRVQVFEALDGLYRRSLIERGKRPGSFTLQSVVLEYVTDRLVAQGQREIQERRLDRLIQHSLCQTTAHEYVRQTQERLLLTPLLVNLQSVYQSGADVAGQAQDSVPTAPVERQLLGLLDQLRERVDAAQGYGPANLIALLRLLRGHLNGLDLSHLCIRGAYLQSVEMHDTSIAGALIRDSIFTQAVSVIWAVAISLDGEWWALGSLRGEVRIWEEKSQTIRQIWQAHTDSVQDLAFSPDGRILASGSIDGTIKLWDLDRGTLLWTGREPHPLDLAFSPDGRLLASGGTDETVRLWDTRDGRNLQTLTHPNQVFAVAFSPDGRLLASSCVDGEIRLWERQKGTLATYVPILSAQSNWVTSLTFAPDGRTLTSTSMSEETVKLWEVASLHLLHTFPGRAGQSKCVAWSPDGGTLAYSSADKAIWLWDVAQGRCRAVLHGHTADIYGMAFTSDGKRLLSGSADGTLRVWDVESSQCVRVVQGYGVSLWDLDWSPDGMYLSSGGTDGVVTIWDLRERTPSRVLHSHTWVVSEVKWSPDGRLLASCGLDMVMRLWNPTSGACVQSFADRFAPFLSMAWSQDGRLLASGTYRGMHVWDVREGCRRWVGEHDQVVCNSAAWSQDGSLLAGGGSDGCVYLWESTDGTLRERLRGPQGRVMNVTWSPDGTRLASGGGERGRGELFVWDVQSRRGSGSSLPVQMFAEHLDLVYAVPWSPNGERLISGGNDGLLRWWDVQSGECVHMQEGHHGKIRSLKVSPDGKLLASCGEDGAIRIWDLESARHLRTLRRDRPYERLNITGTRGLSEAQKSSLQALGAIEDTVS